MSSRILLIEDEPGLQLTLRDLLTGEGYQVAIASDAERGIAQARSGGFDLVFLDAMLPKKVASKSVVSCAPKGSIPLR